MSTQNLSILGIETFSLDLKRSYSLNIKHSTNKKTNERNEEEKKQWKKQTFLADESEVYGIIQ